MNQPIVYDKAKYHLESVHELGLPDSHASNHTAFFFSWLIKHNMLNAEFEGHGSKILEKYRADKTSIHKVYEFFDCCLVSDMLTDEGNAFTQAYFDFEHGQYLHDLYGRLKKDLPSEFMIEYTLENERLIHSLIDRRYQAWGSRWWEFWKRF